MNSKSLNRKNDILTAAMRLAETNGYQTVRRDDVAKEARCSQGTVNRYFSTMPQLRRAIIRYAIKSENLSVIAQAIVMKDTLVNRASAELRKRSMEAALV